MSGNIKKLVILSSKIIVPLNFFYIKKFIKHLKLKLKSPVILFLQLPGNMRPGV